MEINLAQNFKSAMVKKSGCLFKEDEATKPQGGKQASANNRQKVRQEGERKCSKFLIESDF